MSRSRECSVRWMAAGGGAGGRRVCHAGTKADDNVHEATPYRSGTTVLIELLGSRRVASRVRRQRVGFSPFSVTGLVRSVASRQPAPSLDGKDNSQVSDAGGVTSHSRAIL